MMYSIGASTEQATIFSRCSHDSLVSDESFTTVDNQSEFAKGSLEGVSNTSESGQGGTALYKMNCKAFEQVHVTLSSLEDSTHGILKKLLSFRYWIDSQLSRFETWGHDIGVEDSVLDMLLDQDQEQQTFNTHLQECVRRYLLAIHEAVHAVEQRIKLVSQHAHVVQKS
jgi:hypothetical protein